MARTDTVFRDLPASRETLTRPPFKTGSLQAGAVVVSEGTPHRALYLLEQGNVDVLVDGMQVATLGPGAVFGEIGLFTDTVRTATVRASTPLVLRVLGRDGYDALKAAGDPIAGWVERRAGSQLLRRFRELTADIKLQATLSSIEDPLSSVASKGVVLPMPPVMVAAATAHAFPRTDRSLLGELAGKAVVKLFEEGQTLAPSGLRNSAFGVVLAGEVRCMLPVDEGSVPVVSLYSGEALAFEPLVDGKPRPVHHVAGGPTTVLWLDATYVKERIGDPRIGAVLRQPLLRSLAGAVTRANATHRLGLLLNARAQGAEPVPAGSLPPQYQADFEPLPLETPVGFEPPADDWDTWFDVTDTGRLPDDDA